MIPPTLFLGHLILVIKMYIGTILMNKNLTITIKIAEIFDTTAQHMTYFSDMLAQVKNDIDIHTHCSILSNSEISPL